MRMYQRPAKIDVRIEWDQQGKEKARLRKGSLEIAINVYRYVEKYCRGIVRSTTLTAAKIIHNNKSKRFLYFPLIDTYSFGNYGGNILWVWVFDTSVSYCNNISLLLKKNDICETRLSALLILIFRSLSSNS